MPDWTWQPSTQSYRDETGRVVTSEQVREWVLESIRKSGDAVTELARLLAEGKLSLDDWRRLMRDEIKDEYVALFLLGLGGLALLKIEDILLLAELLREQFAYLDRFVVEIGEGLVSDAQAAARARMYTDSAWQSWERGRAQAAARAKKTEVKWTLSLDPAVEHCIDCVAFASLGWQKIASNAFDGAFPASGDTRCLSRCRCNLSYR